jgi:FkbM family methyltransferase
MSTEKMKASLSKIAQNPGWKQSFIESMKSFEKKIETLGLDVREDITGPLVDALFDDDQVVRKELSDGTKLDFFYRSKIARDFVMSEPVRPNHAWEPHTTRLLVKLAAINSKNVVVGGAYFGDQAILVAKEASKMGGVVHAFEPNNDQRGMLMHNADLNAVSNIRPNSEGLWDDASTSLALVGYDSFAHPEKVDVDAEDAFKTVTIDGYLAALGEKSLGLIMLDIEGAELRALQGASAMLSQPAGQAPNIVFEVHRSYVDWSNGLENTDIVRYLTGHGYHVFAVRDFNSNYDLSGKPIEIIPCDAVFLEGPDHGFNMVAVKDVNLLSGKDFRICSNVSPKYLRHKDPALHHPLGGL